MKRSARKEDIESVFSIYMDEAVNPYLGHDPMKMDQFIGVYSQLLSSKAFYVYETDNSIAGFYKADRYPGRASHVAYIGTFAVAPKHHGTGMAKEMLENEITELRNQGILRIEIIVESDNEKAVRFYKKMGFEYEGTLRKFYKRSSSPNYIDDYLMALVF
ncbi:GNAT family N-acetyltransferase [Natronospirillum operosum]|uniref:GNAT family N-acetyltransferase n=1 Tax=Natronospirillum operosum TaxID=2759953 RepID=A0A4Z0WGX5_9GAMM|nr:GNAT family N-acetyltransferase [Natronospirillum operosum]TGG95798.1 GNAT family N-acetyltransferase [Natronospirillum operosum]